MPARNRSGPRTIGSLPARMLYANAAYSASFGLTELSPTPELGLAIVTCMDTRIDPLKVLGLKVGQAHIIRNAGGRATPDVIRSLIVSSELMGTNHVLIVHHTDCGMLARSDEAMRVEIRQKTGHDVSGITFMTFTSLAEGIKEDVEAVRSSALLSETMTVSGFVYDVGTGMIHDVPDE